MQQSSKIQNFISWRVWKKTSLLTSSRLVFDAPQQESSWYSFNSILAMGTNGMNKLFDILLQHGTPKTLHSTQICAKYTMQWNWMKKTSNTKLWEDSICPGIEPKEKVLKTLIYGVKCSCNQAEKGLSFQKTNIQTSTQSTLTCMTVWFVKT